MEERLSNRLLCLQKTFSAWTKRRWTLHGVLPVPSSRMPSMSNSWTCVKTSALYSVKTVRFVALEFAQSASAAAWSTKQYDKFRSGYPDSRVNETTHCDLNEPPTQIENQGLGRSLVFLFIVKDSDT